MATITANITSSAGLIPLSAPVDIGFYSIDSENIYVTGMSRGAEGRDFTRLSASVDRAVGGSTAASHTSGATLTRYYPDAKAGTGGGGVTVDNEVDPPAEVTTIIAPGAVIAGDEATLVAPFPLPIFSVTVELDNAEILTLPTTPVQIVAAPGADKVIVPLFGLMRVNIVGAYVGAGAAALRLMYGASGLASSLLAINLGSTGDLIGSFVSLARFDAEYDPEISSVIVSANDRVNKSLAVKDDWTGGSDYTGGNAANTMTVTVCYIVLDV